MAFLELRGIRKSFGDAHIIKGVDLAIEKGEFIVFVGPSGCGKSTLLRLIAGLEPITSGTLMLDGRDITHAPSGKRDLAMVFQSYALYPHMSVYDNMSFALKLAKVPADEIRRKVEAAAEKLNLSSYLQRTPRELSGGQRQRVAIGRAIVRAPKVFLFDEPLSNLDAALRGNTRVEIKKLHESLGATTIYVTHDQVEAMTLADRVVVMNHGRIEQVGAPNDLYHAPATKFVAGFIGSPAMNFIPCRLEKAAAGINVRLSNDIVLPVPAARTKRYEPYVDNENLLFGLRPEHLSDAHAHANPSQVPFETTLEVTEPMGMETLVYFPINGVDVCGRVNPSAGAQAGGRLRLLADLDNMHLIDDTTGRVL